MKISLFGAGRIANVHARHLAAHSDLEFCSVVDIDVERAQHLATEYRAVVQTVEEVMADKSIDAVLIASSTNTHAELIEIASVHGKAILCEKPIDLTVERSRQAVRAATMAGVPLQIGFNQRFDPSHQALKSTLEDGTMGAVETVVITSRDPGLPPLDYLKVSGGIFRDMTIHDFDLARWIVGSPIVSVTAYGACLVDPGISEVGDSDTASVMMQAENGAIVLINNSRRTTYGYDQRLEVHCAGGMVRTDNMRETLVQTETGSGGGRSVSVDFFLERYSEAYQRQLDAFVQAVINGTAPGPSGEDGVKALELADAATRSRDEKRMIKL
jgi:myo-inositol 2-dehydrogenase/D-chiro-inositol 1-dehydrogenase